MGSSLSVRTPQLEWIAGVVLGIFCVMLTLRSLHQCYQCSCWSTLWCSCYLSPCYLLPASWLSSYLPTLPVFFRCSSTPSFFPDYSVGFCPLSENEAVNEIRDGGWGKPRPEAPRVFQPFLLFGRRSDKVSLTSSQSGTETKAEQAFLCPFGRCTTCIGHGLLWNNDSNRIQFHDAITIKKNLLFRCPELSGCLHLPPKQQHGTYTFVLSWISEYINNADSMNYSNPPATMLAGVEANQLWQESHTRKSNKGSNNLGGSAITLV